MSDGWDDILDPEEDILWQGRPDGRFHFKLHMIASFVFGLIFAGFSLIWMVAASIAGGYFWLLGSAHFFVGIGVAIIPFFKGRFTRRRTWYTLTNKRAYIATQFPFIGRNLKAYPIRPGTPIAFVDGAKPSIYFSHKVSGRRNLPVGFEMIEDGKQVLSIMEDLQKGAIPQPPP